MVETFVLGRGAGDRRWCVQEDDTVRGGKCPLISTLEQKLIDVDQTRLRVCDSGERRCPSRTFTAHFASVNRHTIFSSSSVDVPVTMMTMFIFYKGPTP